MAVNAAADIRTAARPFKMKVSESKIAAPRKKSWLFSGLKPFSSPSKPNPIKATGSANQLLFSTFALKIK